MQKGIISTMYLRDKKNYIDLNMRMGNILQLYIYIDRNRRFFFG